VKIGDIGYLGEYLDSLGPLKGWCQNQDSQIHSIDTQGTLVQIVAVNTSLGASLYQHPFIFRCMICNYQGLASNLRVFTPK